MDDPVRVLPARVEIYDTTLRDGSQLEGISLTVDDKLRIAEQLDWLGSTTSRPGGRGQPKDDEMFRRAATELARHAACSSRSARRAGRRARSTATTRCATCSDANTSTVCIVGKAWDYHVTEALQTTLDEGVGDGRGVVEFLARMRPCGVLSTPSTSSTATSATRVQSCAVLEPRAEGRDRASCLLRHERGTLPHDIERIVREGRHVLRHRRRESRCHLHDDAGTGVAERARRCARRRDPGSRARSTARRAHRQLQPHRTIIPNTHLKMGIETDPALTGPRSGLTPVAAPNVAELVNMALNPQAPYVGESAFAHKAGLHVSAIIKRPDAYEHVPPDSIGNGTRFVVSELAGKSTILLKAQELGLELDGPQVNDVVDTLKQMEHEGYHFEVADASLELLMRRAAGWTQPWFEVESFRVITDDLDTERTPGGVATEATIKVHVGGERMVRTAEGNGPVNALDSALRARSVALPGLDRVHLTDYKVRVSTRQGHRAVTRVLDRLHQRRPHVDHDRRE
jgi:2-isopropylmalate synthase